MNSEIKKKDFEFFFWVEKEGALFVSFKTVRNIDKETIKHVQLMCSEVSSHKKSVLFLLLLLFKHIPGVGESNFPEKLLLDTCNWTPTYCIIIVCQLHDR